MVRTANGDRCYQGVGEWQMRIRRVPAEWLDRLTGPKRRGNDHEGRLRGTSEKHATAADQPLTLGRDDRADPRDRNERSPARERIRPERQTQQT